MIHVLATFVVLIDLWNILLFKKHWMMMMMMTDAIIYLKKKIHPSVWNPFLVAPYGRSNNNRFQHLTLWLWKRVALSFAGTLPRMISLPADVVAVKSWVLCTRYNPQQRRATAYHYADPLHSLMYNTPCGSTMIAEHHWVPAFYAHMACRRGPPFLRWRASSSWKEDESCRIETVDWRSAYLAGVNTSHAKEATGN